MGDRIHHGVLTNHHFIEPSSSHENVRAASIIGYRYSNNNGSFNVQFPPKPDHNSRREAVEKLLDQCKESFKALENQRDERAKVDACPLPNADRNIRSWQNMVKTAGEKVSRTNKLPMDLWRTLVPSGRAINTNLAVIDWAFGELPEILRNSLGLGSRRCNRLSPNAIKYLPQWLKTKGTSKDAKAEAIDIIDKA